ncbi:MAG TPA: TlpA disulfide reductase family protein [Pseudomonadales bacterium]|nr:TlpA disulfide reductase family protein [Pseudomonadales bacterium]
MRSQVVSGVVLQKIILLTFVLLLSACHKQPPATIALQDGNILQPEAWAGKWVYINYWAEWCGPCKEEIPQLNQYAANTADVLVLGVNFDNVRDTKLLAQINKFHITFPVVISDIQTVFKHEVPQQLPATVVINPQGKIVTTLHGPQTVGSLAQARTM